MLFLEPELNHRSAFLDSNPLVCDCFMAQSIKTLQLASSFVSLNFESMICAKPDSLAGENVLEISVEGLICTAEIHAFYLLPIFLLLWVALLCTICSRKRRSFFCFCCRKYRCCRKKKQKDYA